ncbi:hypothetical protein GcM3_042041 [Golovinomyces cichoracearum]|uniref:Secreted effector protein n=1 Tax=Golovinomyces cichoracearum TaxID=62708 RepID=A0A420J1U9_9PEZI|nr:hypothetical protein GcM3_042041 [Golovinomyces cichoracearum]
MRHSTAHLVVAFCSSMAVSAAPLSPLPPNSPALISPSLTPRSVETEDIENKDREAPVQKRSVGGFAYHRADSSTISKRTDDSAKSVMKTQNRPSGEYSDTDSDSDSSSSSDSDIEERSIPALAIRSPPSQEQNEDKNQELADANSLQETSSIQAEDDDAGWNSDDSYAMGSEDLDDNFESASIASDDENFNPEDASSANGDVETLNDDKTKVAETANSAQTIDEAKPETTKRSLGFIA